MPRQPLVAAETNFSGGLKTEFTGLNFPENSCTETFNCIHYRDGSVFRRKGLRREPNFALTTIDKSNKALSSFVWNNADGAGNVDLYVIQVGSTLYFYNISTATPSSPLSTKKLVSTIDLSSFDSSSALTLSQIECQYSTGSGYLFVYNPAMDPIYCSYDAGTVTANSITVKIRDTAGIEEDVEDTYRPATLTDVHLYNLANQGWNKGYKLSSTDTITMAEGEITITVEAGAPILPGDRVRIYYDADAFPNSVVDIYLLGLVVSYSGTSLTVNVTEFKGEGDHSVWTIVSEPALISTWADAIGNYPSNSDVWWYFKTVKTEGTSEPDPDDADILILNRNTMEVFDPGKTIKDVSQAAGPAPKGRYILSAFYQDRTEISGVDGLDVVSTEGIRPSTGAWFQGRVWYTGVNYKGFTEKIYFSQIIENKSQFGKCHQVNDPTSEERYDLLPSDGGVIVIQGSGTINKLFPVQNGLLVHSNKGVWFITGSQGIGFTANDYTVVKLSSIQTISSSSFVNVQGFPLWWNEEGIYSVVPQQGGSLNVQSLTDATIASFYKDIPTVSKKFVRGDWDPITGVIQWLYRSTPETDVEDRYEFDSVLNFNTLTSSFYPWTLKTTNNKVSDVKYIYGQGDVNSIDSYHRYLTFNGTSMTIAEQTQDTYQDWAVEDYESYFISGYKIPGAALRDAQVGYLIVYSRNDLDTEYKIQGIWDFANSGNSGRWSTVQRISIAQDNFDNAYRRHKIRGHGKALQFKITSVSQEPFHILGWAGIESVNANV